MGYLTNEGQTTINHPWMGMVRTYKNGWWLGDGLWNCFTHINNNSSYMLIIVSVISI